MHPISRVILRVAALALVIPCVRPARGEPTGALGGGSLSLTLKPEELSGQSSAGTPAYKALDLVSRAGGRYEVRLSPGVDRPELPDFDVSVLLPHVPRLARGNATLTRLALIQREFNRNEVHNDLPDGRDLSLANNCLRQGLWEVKLAQKGRDKTTLLYHAWFTFPKDEYARLFQKATGLPYADYESVLASYPTLGGFPLPLGELRAVVGERESGPVATHATEPLQRLSEQEAKKKLLLSAGLARYGDFSASGKQPIVTAKFSEPGFYDSKESMRFDLSWLAEPTRLVWRRVKNPRVEGTFPEIEVTFASGQRIVVADSRLESLEPRTLAPERDSEVLKVVFGIGTPDIHGSAADRARELEEDRPRYLMVLDAKGNHVDNHLAGIDGVYVWREGGDPGSVHLWLVSYERIALVAHLSSRWLIPPPEPSAPRP
jgi:hypothetical protein